MTPHVPVAPDLQVEAKFKHVPEYLELHDPDLRLRKSVDYPNEYVLERRCRRTPGCNAGMLDASDFHVQARDGYIHISHVHPNWLEHHWNIIAALSVEGADLWAIGGAAVFSDEQEYEERWMEETKRRRRHGLYRDIAADAYGPLSAIGNADGTDRTQIGMATKRPWHRQRLTPNVGSAGKRSLKFFLGKGNSGVV